jgi:hypothetical protein
LASRYLFGFSGDLVRVAALFKKPELLFAEIIWTRDPQTRRQLAMNTSIFLDACMSAEERRARLYAGDIFASSETKSTRELVAFARDLLEGAFAPHDPRSIHEHKTAEQVSEILAKLKPQFIHHPTCKILLPRILAENGCDLEKTYFDVPRMRSAFPSHFLSSGIAYAFHPHRDTWYSAPACQLNWWIPIYPLQSDNAMAFYPRYFSEPVQNNSEIFNYYEWNTKNRATAAQHVKSDTREQPKAQQDLDRVTVRLLPPPGAMIVFSGAQLHETVENTTAFARYSIDFRTVDYDDILARRGAPNIDSHCTGTTMRDYLRCTDLVHLPDAVVRLYDDHTEVADHILYFGERCATDSVT